MAEKIIFTEEKVGDGDVQLMDTLGEDVMCRVDTKLTLVKLIRDLEPNERALIVNRYFRSRTQAQIAKEMGVSQVQISRMEKKILARMRVSAGE